MQDEVLPEKRTQVPSAGDAGLHRRGVMSVWAVRAFTIRLRAILGRQFSVLLFYVYFCQKGALLTLLNGGLLILSRRLGWDSQTFQSSSVVANAPYAIKGIIGAASDAIPIGGLHKTPWIIITAVFGAAAAMSMAVMDFQWMQSFFALAPLLFFVLMWQVATADLLCEGKYAAMMALAPKSRSDVVSYVWFNIQSGSFVAALGMGPLADLFGARAVLLLMVPLSFATFRPLLRGFMPMDEATEGSGWLQIAKILEQKKLFILSVSISMCAIGQVIVSIVTKSRLVQMLYVVLVSIVLLIFQYRVLTRTLALVNIYSFIAEVTYINLSGATDYFYTAREECIPGGPAFSYTYYQSFVLIVGIAASGIGLWVFQAFMSNWTYRHIFWVTALIRVVASLGDLVLVTRFNRFLGLPDRLVYLVGDAVIIPSAMMMAHIPSSVLTAKLCEKSMESTMYAIQAGLSNFGTNVSRTLGVFALRLGGVHIREGLSPCQVGMLPHLIVVCHLIMPLVSIGLSQILVPNCTLDVDLRSVEYGHTDCEGLNSSTCSSNNIPDLPSLVEIVPDHKWLSSDVEQ